MSSSGLGHFESSVRQLQLQRAALQVWFGQGSVGQLRVLLYKERSAGPSTRGQDLCTSGIFCPCFLFQLLFLYLHHLLLLKDAIHKITTVFISQGITSKGDSYLRQFSLPLPSLLLCVSCEHVHSMYLSDCRNTRNAHTRKLHLCPPPCASCSCEH